MTTYRDSADPTGDLIADRRDYDPDQRLERVADDLARLAGGEYRPAYNGWTNRETWNASLWINNDEGTYNAAREIVRAAMDGSDYDTRGIIDPAEDRRYQIRTAGDALREWWDEANAPDGASPLSDAWSYAVAVTDWYAVADGLAEDMPAAGSNRRTLPMTTNTITGITGISLNDIRHSDLRREAGRAALRWLTARSADEDGDIAGDIAADAATPDQLDEARETFDALGDAANDAEAWEARA